MAQRKWREIKQQPSMLPGPAVPGCSLVSFHFLWAILCPQAVQCFSVIVATDIVTNWLNIVTVSTFNNPWPVISPYIVTIFYCDSFSIHHQCHVSQYPGCTVLIANRIFWKTRADLLCLLEAELGVPEYGVDLSLRELPAAAR